MYGRAGLRRGIPRHNVEQPEQGAEVRATQRGRELGRGLQRHRGVDARAAGRGTRGGGG